MTDTSLRLSSLGSLRRNAAGRLGRQQVRESLLGSAFYVMAAVAVLAAVGLVYNSVRFVGESGLNIINQPLKQPLQAAIILILLYVTADATLAISRPREQGALQVLFFAPVDEVSLVGGYFLGGLATYAAFLILVAPPLLIGAAVMNFVVPSALVWALIPTVIVAGLAVSFGLFVSAAAPSARAAVFLLVGATLILLALQGGFVALLSIPPTSRFYDALLFLRVVLRNVNIFLLWVSPFSMADAVLESVLRADWLALAGHLGAALGGTAVWLSGAVWALRRRGVLP
jgi:hypothetical protein